MAKPIVLVGEERERVPYLRGILTRSLQDAGLSFEDSYRVASAVREELGDDTELTTEELRARVIPHLRPLGAELAERYARPSPDAPNVLVHAPGGHAIPYSRGYHRQRLQACGLSFEDASTAATAIYDRLKNRRVLDVSADDLQTLTHEHLETELGPEWARRYSLWEEFHHSDRPLLILIGGTAGSGKSTVASEVAHLLEIVRTQSTDMLREVMRVMIPSRLLPALHTSSFSAWRELPSKDGPAEDPDTPLVNGYLTQAELLSVPCGAVIERALQERVSLILEGVHVNPGLLRAVPPDSDAIVVPIMLGVLRSDVLQARIRGRGHQAPDRRARRYLEHFDAIWRLQSFLLSEADRAGVPIVPNTNKERTVQQVMASILHAISQGLAGDRVGPAERGAP